LKIFSISIQIGNNIITVILPDLPTNKKKVTLIPSHNYF
jgi:hypothetical protein